MTVEREDDGHGSSAGAMDDTVHSHLLLLLMCEEQFDIENVLAFAWLAHGSLLYVLLQWTIERLVARSRAQGRTGPGRARKGRAVHRGGGGTASEAGQV